VWETPRHPLKDVNSPERGKKRWERQNRGLFKKGKRGPPEESPKGPLPKGPFYTPKEGRLPGLSQKGEME